MSHILYLKIGSKIDCVVYTGNAKRECIILFLNTTLNSDKVERVQHRAARFVKSRYTIYSSVSDMLDELGWPPLSQSRQEAQLFCFYKTINGLAQVPFEGVLVEAYKGTRRKHNMTFRQIGHATSQYGQSFFPKTISAWNRIAFAEAPSYIYIYILSVYSPFSDRVWTSSS